MLDYVDGRASFGEFETYYKVFGENKSDTQLPLVVLHGGPGSAHNYMLDVSRVAETGRQVIFYDQVGCGLSTGPDDMAEYTFELFIDELNNLRDYLRIEDIHLLGHSWGGMLAIEYLLSKPQGVHSAILASAMISMPLFTKELSRLRAKLPKGVQKTLEKHEQDGSTNAQEYDDAYREYHRRHIFRGEQKPPYAQAPENDLAHDIYDLLWGVNEAYPDGSLGNWDRSQDLGKITVPTLVTSGTFDELTPKQAKMTALRLPNATRAEFAFSAHLPHMEEPGRYIETVNEFLAGVESSE